MRFCFYPDHKFACPQLKHCPHLGGAALGPLVRFASTSGDSLDRLHRQLDAARQSVSFPALTNHLPRCRTLTHGASCRRPRRATPSGARPARLRGELPVAHRDCPWRTVLSRCRAALNARRRAPAKNPGRGTKLIRVFARRFWHERGVAGFRGHTRWKIPQRPANTALR
jgi:hypothetical protein